MNIIKTYIIYKMENIKELVEIFQEYKGQDVDIEETDKMERERNWWELESKPGVFGDERVELVLVYEKKRSR